MKVWNVASRILQVLLRRKGVGVGQFGGRVRLVLRVGDYQNPSGCSSGTVKTV